MKKAAKKTKREPKDINELAFSIVESLTSEDQPIPEELMDDSDTVESGRRGGLKGGKARAEKLTSEQRRAIAKKAAAGRWKKED